jgi:3-phenylpropionate/cinnamic acid dioxygenase small subunit
MALRDIRDAGRSEIEALTAAYVHALDDGELERWPGFFTADCVYKVIPRENYENGLPLAVWYCQGRGMLQDRVTAIRETQLFAPRALRHVTGSLHVLNAEAGALHAVTNYAVYESPFDGPSLVFNVGRYLDRIVLEDGRLKFAEKLCVFDPGSVPTSLIYPI